MPSPDLFAVYHRAHDLAARADPDIAIWELYNEPDVGFCPALPDRFAASAKATYLGLEAAGSKPILLPSLALPPGPWAERAAANGLFAYGDGANLHYYGREADFPGFLRLARNFFHGSASGRAELPLWITEIGIELPDASRASLARQSRYFSSTLRAAADARVAAFFPYAFRDGNYSLVDEAGAPRPALGTYLKSTKTRSLGNGEPAVAESGREVSRTILQWAPAPGNCRPDKVSGCYFFPPARHAGHGAYL